MSLLRDDDPPALVSGVLVVWLMVLGALARPSEPAPAKVAPVSIRTRYGAVLPHEGTVTLEITVEPHADNRWIAAAIESEDHADASGRELRGTSSPKTWQFQFKDLPDGNYTAWAHLLRTHGQQDAQTTFIVGRDMETPF